MHKMSYVYIATNENIYLKQCIQLISFYLIIYVWQSKKILLRFKYGRVISFYIIYTNILLIIILYFIIFELNIITIVTNKVENLFFE